MQVTSQNVQQQNIPQQVKYNCNYNNSAAPTAQVAQPTQQPTQAPAQYSYPQNYYVPQTQSQIQQAQAVQTQQPTAQQPQNMQIPSSMSGVNIQIFNPSVTPPGATPPTYNVNAPCYPSNYYTNPMGGNGANNAGQAGANANANANANGTNGTSGSANGVNGQTGTDKNSSTNTTTETESKDGKKTEKKKIVQLTDDYIKNLENYLNSQEKDVRLSAAKEVYSRLEEDESRKDDKALTALINKMLQDPSEEIRVLAMAALQGRIVTGDDFTVGVLTRMQNDKAHYGMDAVDASKILLQMSGKQVEKEVPVSEKSQKKEKTETKQEETKSSIKK